VILEWVPGKRALLVAKILVALGVLVGITTGAPAPYIETEIYYSAPQAPNLATGETHLVHVMRGFSRYVTADEEKRFHFWQDEVEPFVQISILLLLAGVFVLALSQHHERSDST
jgi:hypothetical protein